MMENIPRTIKTLPSAMYVTIIAIWKNTNANIPAAISSVPNINNKATNEAFAWNIINVIPLMILDAPYDIKNMENTYTNNCWTICTFVVCRINITIPSATAKDPYSNEVVNVLCESFRKLVTKITAPTINNIALVDIVIVKSITPLLTMDNTIITIPNAMRNTLDNMLNQRYFLKIDMI